MQIDTPKTLATARNGATEVFRRPRTLRRSLGLARAFLLFGAVGVVFSGGLARAALIYNESSYPGGDYLGSGFPNIGTLGIGLNTISGAVSGAFPGSPQDDYEDTFSVTLPAGLVITSGQLVITNFTFGFSILGPPSINNGSATEPLNATTTINANGTYNLILNLPYSTSGSLNVDIKSSYTCGSGNLGPCSDGGFNYSVQYTAAASGVPEPSTGIALAIGLSVLAFARCRSIFRIRPR